MAKYIQTEEGFQHRTHYDSRKIEPIVIKFDGNIDGKDTIPFNGGLMVRISHETPTPDEWVDGTVIFHYFDNYEEEYKITKNDIQRFEDGTGYTILDESIIIQLIEYKLNDELIIPIGIWVWCEFADYGAFGYVKYLTRFVEKGELKKIDFKYMPDEVTNLENQILNYVDYTPKKNIVLADDVNGYSYIVSMKNGNLISYCQTSYIRVTTLPKLKIYTIQESFNPAGMIVTAYGADGTSREIIDYTYDEKVSSDNANNFVITYKELDNVYATAIQLYLHDFSLIDFDYISNEDGTYTLVEWKGTCNGEPSTKIIIPNSELIIV